MKKYISIVLSIMSLFIFPYVVDADTATISYDGKSSAYRGSNIVVKLNVSGNDIASLSGVVTYDSTYLELVSVNGLFQFNKSGNKVAYLNTDGNYLKGTTTGLNLTFKALKNGSTTIGFDNAKASKTVVKNNVAESAKMDVSVSSKRITIVDPPSNNNFLSSLTTNQGNINFNKNTTNYSLNVESGVSHISINATAEDSKAKVSGTGNINLNFGKNTIKVIVTAEDGSQKTYTITVNRKDNRSTNNDLSSLSVSNGKLSPNFKKDVTSYNMEVPFSVSSLDIKAVADDSKSKVSIANNKLVAEAITDVKIIVTAENGSTKTYVIKVKRGKDPNKQLSTNNYLASLSVNNGILSPVFNREKNNYVVYLPFEIDSIEIAAIVEDTTYATLKVDGPNSLNVGTNTYTFTVTAEDESVRVYTVNVIRGRSLDSDSTNTYLKEINLKNGKLKGKFDKNTYLYYYSKTKGFSVNAIAEDENSEVAIKYVEDVVIITVSDSTNDFSVYVLLPKENNSYKYIIIGIIAFVVGSITGIGISKFIKKRKTLK